MPKQNPTACERQHSERPQPPVNERVSVHGAPTPSTLYCHRAAKACEDAVNKDSRVVYTRCLVGVSCQRCFFALPAARPPLGIAIAPVPHPLSTPVYRCFVLVRPGLGIGNNLKGCSPVHYPLTIFGNLEHNTYIGYATN